jgi:hypothetical protein
MTTQKSIPTPLPISSTTPLPACDETRIKVITDAGGRSLYYPQYCFANNTWYDMYMDNYLDTYYFHSRAYYSSLEEAKSRIDRYIKHKESVASYKTVETTYIKYP